MLVDGIYCLLVNGISLGCLPADEVDYLLANEFSIIENRDWKLASNMICNSTRAVVIADEIAKITMVNIVCWVARSHTSGLLVLNEGIVANCKYA